ncbi:MAG: type II CAAX prenyl endopeptidase Rce1 family protein [Christensenellales bacterium]
MSGLSAVALSTAGTLLCFLLPALAGLFMLDGDQHRMIALRALSAQHMLCLAAAGALFIGPAALLAELPGAALGSAARKRRRRRVTPDSALFLPMLLQSALLAPICEELFFRGYRWGVRQGGSGRAIAAAALLFAAAHGVDAAFLPRFLLGCLLGGMARRTGSILAPMLMHGCYNAAVLLLGFAGASFAGRSLFFCALGLLGAVLCFAMVARVYRARANRAPVEWGGALSRKEMAKIAAAVLAVIAAVIVSGVTKP